MTHPLLKRSSNNDLPVMAASRDDKGAIVRALDSEIKGVTRDLKKEVNYQLFWDGTAKRALVNGDPGSGQTTLTLDTPGTMYLFDDAKIDIVDPSTGTPTANSTDLTVSSVDSSTEVTMSASIDDAVADNDAVVLANSTDDAGTSYEMMGLRGIVDDAEYVTTLFNIDRSSYAWWNCSTHDDDDNSGTNRDLTLDLIQASVTAVEKNGGKVNLILSDHERRDSYASLLVSDKRHVNTMDLDGGFRALEYNGIPWVADPDCPPNTVFFLDTDHLQIMQMSDWDWMDRQLCSSKIWLYAGNSEKSLGANYARIRSDRLSAGKPNVLAGGGNGLGGLFFYYDKKGKGKGRAVFLPRYFNREYKSDFYRRMCDYIRGYLWLPHRNKTAKRQAKNDSLANTDTWFQTMREISASDYSSFSGEKGAGRVFARVCENQRSKQCGKATCDEKTHSNIEESPETIRRTVQHTEDIVRTSWRHEELGRNVQALA